VVEACQRRRADLQGMVQVRPGTHLGDQSGSGTGLQGHRMEGTRQVGTDHAEGSLAVVAADAAGLAAHCLDEAETAVPIAHVVSANVA
jgi:hypothetical protein